MDYKRIYKEFIADRRKKQKALKASDEYYETHHIKPRSLGGSDHARNLIALTPEDHIFAHLLLGAIHGGHQWLPVVRMARKGKALCEKYGLPYSKHNRRMAHGIAKRAHAKYLSESKKGKPRPEWEQRYADQENLNIYHWEHKETGEKVSATLREMRDKTGIVTNKLSCVAHGINKSRNGWKLQGTEIIPAYDQIRDHRIYNFIHCETGERFSSTRQGFYERTGLPSTHTGFFYGKVKTCNGWTLDDGRKITSGKYANVPHHTARAVLCFETGDVFSTIREAGEWAGIDRRLISACAGGKQESAGGYRWEYVEAEG